MSLLGHGRIHSQLVATGAQVGGCLPLNSPTTSLTLSCPKHIGRHASGMEVRRKPDTLWRTHHMEVEHVLNTMFR